MSRHSILKIPPELETLYVVWWNSILFLIEQGSDIIHPLNENCHKQVNMLALLYNFIFLCGCENYVIFQQPHPTAC